MRFEFLEDRRLMKQPAPGPQAAGAAGGSGSPRDVRAESEQAYINTINNPASPQAQKDQAMRSLIALRGQRSVESIPDEMVRQAFENLNAQRRQREAATGGNVQAEVGASTTVSNTGAAIYQQERNSQIGLSTQARGGEVGGISSLASFGTLINGIMTLVHNIQDHGFVEGLKLTASSWIQAGRDYQSGDLGNFQNRSELESVAQANFDPKAVANENAYVIAALDATLAPTRERALGGALGGQPARHGAATQTNAITEARVANAADKLVGHGITLPESRRALTGFRNADANRNGTLEAGEQVAFTRAIKDAIPEAQSREKFLQLVSAPNPNAAMGG